MRLNNNSANFHRNSHSHKEMPSIASKENSLLSSSNSASKQSESAFDMTQSSGTLDNSFTQQLATLVFLIKSLLESMTQSASTDKPSVVDSDSTQSASGCHGNRASGSSGQNTVNPFTNVTDTETDNTSVTDDSGTVSNSQSTLPAINSNDWSTRDGKNGEEFATPFVSKNVIKDGNSITTQLKGNEGAEATLDKKIGTGFYQFNVNPKLSSQVGDIPTVFFYSGKGSDGGDYEGGFELDAEYNMVDQGTVTFGTWIDGKKYNEVTVPAPKGDQTIGFNIQDGVSQIGFVNSDGTFEPVSETKDKRITPELASNLQAMTNTWRSKSTGGSDNGEISSIAINGFGRSDEPGQPVKAV